ncbi:hypothetical protein NCCP2716_29240 [Sporosarcina sp. NCCP-2716]|uniref:hypothetical protein n=1 Tax=Sporosarcina sp. NCCP-2716 TaxID=2943679 RepID=UPI00203C0D5C|nr:hypothetical protein [Sporosarcina sp. NCCP-2716]GKV70426.1 hypothetical protein NCCP2716_29240 [Sporosarcina sp. NCCP-2716]
MKQGTHEDDHLRRWLHDDVPPVIHEQDREAAIDYLKSYMPVPQENTAAVMKQLVRQSFQDLWGHFAVQLGLLVIALMGAVTFIPGTKEQWLLFILSAPAPVFVAGWHLVHTQTKDMVELEQTFIFSFQQVLFSKLVSICLGSLVLYSGSLLYAASIQKAGLFLLSFHIAVTGITPILLFCVILLAISTKYRYPLSWTVILLVWVSFLLLSIYTPIGSWLLSVHTLVFLAVNIGLVVVFIRQLTKLWRMERLPDGI